MDEKFEERTGEYEGREAHRLEHAGAIALFLLSPVFSYVMFEFVTGNFVMVLPKNAVLNIVWMFALYLLVFGISGSTRISVPVSSVLLYAISLAEAFVVSFRSRPIMMGDVLAVKTAMTVAGSYDYTPTFMMIICGVLLIIWNALAQFVFVRVKGKKKRAAVFSVSAGAVAVFIACFYNFMISGLSLEVNLWDPMTSYAENGYILSSAISIKYLVKKAPGGYSQAKIQEICDKYVDSEKERNGETAAVVASGDAVQPTNIICIMNESLSDLAVDGDFTTNIDYLPFLRSLTENTVKGKLCMPVFGAMTSNSEFEFLIGDSMYLMPRGSVAYQFYVNPGVRSMVSTVRDQGYIPVAMHPYPAENWNRRICYNNMGFSDFMDISAYESRDELRNYISDLSDFKVITEYIEQKANPDDKLFLFNVTMQNHGGYSEDEPAVDVTVTPVDKELQTPQMLEYLSLIRESDAAFKELTDYFSEAEEDTVILMFGDHQPSMDEGVSEFMDRKLEERDGELDSQRRYYASFILWANFDIQEMSDVVTSPGFLRPLLLEAAGVPMNAYESFLFETAAAYPAMNAFGCFDASGQWNSRMEDEEGVLEEYQYLVYQNVFDKKSMGEGYR